MTFCEIANAIDSVRSVRGSSPSIIFWENVPGVLSTDDNAFGCFLAGLAGEDDPLEPPGGKWTNAGAVLGPARTVAWRILDAQYFGVAQRRRRVFVVASARNGFDPAAVLFEFDGLRRDTAPSREAGQSAAATLDARAEGGGFPGSDGACGGHVVPVCPTLRAGGNQTGGDRPPGTDVDTADSLIVQPYEVANCLTARMHKGINSTLDEDQTPATTHTLRGEGFDASEDGTGRGTPLVPVVPFDTTQVTSAANRSNPKPGDPCHPLAAGAHAPTIAFPANLSGTQHASTENLAPAMGAKNPTAVAVALRGREGGATAELGDEVQNCLRASSGGGDKPHVLAPVHAIQAGALRVNPASGPDGVGVQADHAYTLEARAEVQAVQAAMQVRRLTPRECERLQGFPDGYTMIPWRKKPADQCPDGPRYKALGNSWAVPVVRWIGQRIAAELKRGEL